jgi:hypothetical protein
MPQLQEPIPDFAELYAEPSIERMLPPALTLHQFEHFDKYVFEQADYFVEDSAGRFGEGLDLKLYAGPADARVLRAGVSVKQFTPPSTVNGPTVMGFRGALAQLGCLQGFIVTTSTFGGHDAIAVSRASLHPLIVVVNQLMLHLSLEEFCPLFITHADQFPPMAWIALVSVSTLEETAEAFLTTRNAE